MASVPSGGAGGAAPAAGGAAAGAAAEEAPAEEKEEGTLSLEEMQSAVANTTCREGRVRRGYGFRSLRLRNQLIGYGFLALDIPIHGQGHLE